MPSNIMYGEYKGVAGGKYGPNVWANNPTVY